MERHATVPPMVGRYAMHDKIAAGGMATVYLGRLVGPVGFSRTVAIKRLHPELAAAPELVAMLIDEARITGLIRHPNVVSMLDVVATNGEVFLVMDYVQGESLVQLLHLAREASAPIPLAIVSAILVGVLHGLHAAHETVGADGRSLGIVHRDISPQNVMIGADGVARVIDFGVAKAIGRLTTTREGEIKGKLAYMPPEQWSAAEVTRAADVYAAGVVAWEMLTLERLYGERSALAPPLAFDAAPAPSSRAAHVPKALDQVVLRALSAAPEGRFATAQDMALAIERIVPPASPAAVGAWVTTLAHATLAHRSDRVAALEAQTIATMIIEAWPPPDAPRSRATPADVPVAADRADPRSSRRRRGAMALAVAVVLVCAGALASRARHPTATATEALARSSSSAMTIGSVTLPTMPTMPTTEHAMGALSRADTTLSAAPSPRSEEARDADASLPPAAATAAATARRLVSPRRAPTACDPPYLLDRNGQRQYKPLCLR